MALNDNELARRDAASGAVECRGSPLRVDWAFSSLPSADSHALDVRLGASVRVADSNADRRLFVETMFVSSRDAVTAEVVRDTLAPVLRATLTTLASRQPAADAIGNAAAQQKWIDSLRQTADAVAFAAGMEIVPPLRLDVRSPTLEREQLERVARARSEERTAGQAQHLAKAAELLKQFQAMRAAAPEVPAGVLLERMNPADRGAALESLLLAGSQQSRPPHLWAVAGAQLIDIDPRAATPRMVPMDLPESLGPLRSVRHTMMDGKSVLLVGARCGVALVDRVQPTSAATIYAVPPSDSQLGFSRVIVAGRFLYASHGELGILRWRLDSPQTAATTLETPHHAVTAQARNLRSLDDTRILFTIGNTIFAGAPDALRRFSLDGSSEIISILDEGAELVAIQQDGTITTLERESFQVRETRRRGVELSAAGRLPWMGESRLLLASETGPITCAGLRDSLVSEFLSPYRGMKIVTACGDLIAAVTPDRQRIVIWNSWDGQAPRGEVHVTSKLRHRVADIAFGGD